MLALNWRICEKIATVIGCVSRPKVSTTNRSFHTQRNWKIASDAIAEQAERQDQPEEDRAARTRRRCAASSRSRGIPMKKFRSRRSRGSERRVEQDQPEDGVEGPGRCRGEDGNQRHLDRDDEQPDDHEEQPVAPEELEPGEGVAGERRDHDREDRPAERDPRVT